jgi:hypothetical protein
MHTGISMTFLGVKLVESTEKPKARTMVVKRASSTVAKFKCTISMHGPVLSESWQQKLDRPLILVDNELFVLMLDSLV